MRLWTIAAILILAVLAPVQAQEKNVTLVYIGGWDCGPCITWKQNEKPAFLRSPEYQKVNYVEIESPKLREAYEERYWPEKYRAILAQIPKKVGTPRFLVVKDGVIVGNDWGNSPWKRTLTKLKEVVS